MPNNRLETVMCVDEDHGQEKYDAMNFESNSLQKSDLFPLEVPKENSFDYLQPRDSSPNQFDLSYEGQLIDIEDKNFAESVDNQPFLTQFIPSKIVQNKWNYEQSKTAPNSTDKTVKYCQHKVRNIITKGCPKIKKRKKRRKSAYYKYSRKKLVKIKPASKLYAPNIIIDQNAISNMVERLKALSLVDSKEIVDPANNNLNTSKTSLKEGKPLYFPEETVKYSNTDELWSSIVSECLQFIHTKNSDKKDLVIIRPDKIWNMRNNKNDKTESDESFEEVDSQFANVVIKASTVNTSFEENSFMHDEELGFTKEDYSWSDLQKDCIELVNNLKVHCENSKSDFEVKVKSDGNQYSSVLLDDFDASRNKQLTQIFERPFCMNTSDEVNITSDSQDAIQSISEDVDDKITLYDEYMEDIHCTSNEGRRYSQQRDFTITDESVDKYLEGDTCNAVQANFSLVDAYTSDEELISNKEDYSWRDLQFDCVQLVRNIKLKSDKSKFQLNDQHTLAYDQPLHPTEFNTETDNSNSIIETGVNSGPEDLNWCALVSKYWECMYARRVSDIDCGIILSPVKALNLYGNYENREESGNFDEWLNFTKFGSVIINDELDATEEIRLGQPKNLVTATNLKINNFVHSIEGRTEAKLCNSEEEFEIREEECLWDNVLTGRLECFNNTNQCKYNFQFGNKLEFQEQVNCYNTAQEVEEFR